MWSRKQMPVAISPRFPRFSTVHSACTCLLGAAHTPGAPSGGGGTSNVRSTGVGGRDRFCFFGSGASSYSSSS